MAHVLIMPRQGNTVESCIICEWKVKEGDSVKEDTPVCSVETDKAAFEIPAGAAGTILKILHECGDDVPVLEPIMVLGNPGEDWQTLLGENSTTNHTNSDLGSVHEQKKTGNQELVEVSEVRGEISTRKDFDLAPREDISSGVSPRARKLAEKEAVPLDAVPGSGPDGRIIEQDIASYADKRPPMTNAAKDELRKHIKARYHANLEGSGAGLGGMITAAELENVFTHHITAPEAPKIIHLRSAEEIHSIKDEFTDTPIRGIRKLIADKMTKSASICATFTLNSSAPAVKLNELRSGFKAACPDSGLNKITINDLILFAVSRVLLQYPYMNVHRTEDSIRSWKNVHLGIAVTTGRGLMVPVMRNADSLSLVQISEKARELATACRKGSISPDDLQGSTFTVSNLGSTGIESFSPVINIPEAAILGVCGIAPKPVETSPGQYSILPHIGLSLTVDHAVIDGAPAAEFLKALCEAIREIDMRIISECIAL